MANEPPAKMDRLFAGMYEVDIKGGRPSIAPEKLLRAMLIQVLYSIRSERQFMEQVQYNLLFRWFIGLAMSEIGLNPPKKRETRVEIAQYDKTCGESRVTQKSCFCRGGFQQPARRPG
jgi:transposase